MAVMREFTKNKPMSTLITWDYTALAATYDKRPDYSSHAIQQVLDRIGAKPGQRVADIGAGTGRLTHHLLKRGLVVTAVEPNTAMRAIGVKNTQGKEVTWCTGTAEATGLPENTFHLVTFGSSFTVTERMKALQETARILVSEGWFVCLWNHRDLSDPIQAEVEAIIRRLVPNYEYGARREDQTLILQQSGLFKAVSQLEDRFIVQVPVCDYVDAWYSHATLARQAGEDFEKVISAVRQFLVDQRIINVPYDTRIWYAQLHRKSRNA
jgi:ubiquinone/menaquinone biosynthesis C-methylase UbiE